jgi:hypothetical protein
MEGKRYPSTSVGMRLWEGMYRIQNKRDPSTSVGMRLWEGGAGTEKTRSFAPLRFAQDDSKGGCVMAKEHGREGV